MTWFRREPLIYDLWADIRVHWILADYFESKWAAVDSLKDCTPFANKDLSTPKLFPAFRVYTYVPTHLKGQSQNDTK